MLHSLSKASSNLATQAYQPYTSVSGPDIDHRMVSVCTPQENGAPMPQLLFYGNDVDPVRKARGGSGAPRPRVWRRSNVLFTMHLVLLLPSIAHVTVRVDGCSWLTWHTASRIATRVSMVRSEPQYSSHHRHGRRNSPSSQRKSKAYPLLVPSSFASLVIKVGIPHARRCVYVLVCVLTQQPLLFCTDRCRQDDLRTLSGSKAARVPRLSHLRILFRRR